MAIKLDESRTGIVIYCTDCDYWSAFRFHRVDAWEVACRHEEQVHPEDTRQRHARDERNSAARRVAIPAT